MAYTIIAPWWRPRKIATSDQRVLSVRVAMRSCERDDTDGRCTLKGSEENVGIEIVIPDAQLERYEDGFNNENTIQRDGIKAQRTRPDDDPHVILAALRDSSCQCWYSWPVSALELISVSIPEVLEILGTSCLIRIEP
ncbi:uncharacterized protein ARMOST_22314 [Armillaria ostoyae]|uniref:Uncharacterized protein n=1 Tax=Armillaria ostoyae TaxID=47428 RepID=A0A284SCI6_ARMOS|nr:uncharacterized protein ARMOST_22314 [Armillaria ostoyae]